MKQSSSSARRVTDAWLEGGVIAVHTSLYSSADLELPNRTLQDLALHDIGPTPSLEPLRGVTPLQDAGELEKPFLYETRMQDIQPIAGKPLQWRHLPAGATDLSADQSLRADDHMQEAGLVTGPASAPPPRRVHPTAYLRYPASGLEAQDPPW